MHASSEAQFRCALVTGASSGFGTEYAHQLAPITQNLILTARREQLLTEISSKLTNQYPQLTVYQFPADLITDQGRQSLLDFLSRNNLQPDLLINNAGMGDYGEFTSADWSKTQAMIRLNTEAPTHLAHALLPKIIEQQGAILNVSSLASTLPIPDFAVYAATKAYLTSLSEALRLETKSRQVHIHAVCPGPSETNFGNTARRPTTKKMPIKDSFCVPPEKIVRDSLSSLLKNRATSFPGLKTRLAATLINSLPKPLLRLLLSTRPRRSD